jgi:hypothetical protein
MEATALKLVETNEVETKALTIVDQAKAVKVTDGESYAAAGGLWKQIGDMIKEVKDTFDPICDAAHKTHKAAVEKRSKFLDPLTTVQKSVKALMSAYDAEQERIRKAEQDRLAAIARKAEEDRLLAEASAVEAEARANGATKEEAAQQADAVIAEPIYVPPIIVAKATPKLAGGPVFQTRWDFEVVNESLIPRQFLSVDLVKIRQIVTAMKGQTNIPGVRAFERRV